MVYAALLLSTAVVVAVVLYVGHNVRWCTATWTLSLERKTLAQYEELKAAIAQMATDLSEAIARVDARIGELGDPDPDLSAEIASLRDASQRLDALAAAPDSGPTPTPEPSPTPPAPEPSPAPPPGPGPEPVDPNTPAPEPGDDPGDGPPPPLA